MAAKIRLQPLVKLVQPRDGGAWKLSAVRNVAYDTNALSENTSPDSDDFLGDLDVSVYLLV